MQWGGPEEQAAERAAGNPNAVDWCDEALKVVESTMREYAAKHGPKAPTIAPTTVTTVKSNSRIVESEFDRHRRTLVEQASHDHYADWRAELRRYLGDVPDDVSKDTDVVDWWSVRQSFQLVCFITLIHFIRNMLRLIQFLHESQWMYVPSLLHLYHANSYSRLVERLPPIGAHV
jgi:hypothetical protein